MHVSAEMPRPVHGRMWLGVLVLLVTQLGVTFLSRGAIVSSRDVLLAAAVAAAGTLAMAALFAPVTPYPRWALWTTAAVLGVCLVASTVTAGSPSAWVDGVRPSAWFMPWFVFLMQGVFKTPTHGVCAPQSRWAGWIMIGTGVLLAAILLLVTPFVATRLH